jgi:primosomal protein N'
MWRAGLPRRLRAGVERIADEVAQILPEARVALVTSDTLTSAAKAANSSSRPRTRPST